MQGNLTKKIFIVLAIIVKLLGLNGCLDDVPHSNPLDPANGDQIFEVRGSVSTYYQPRKNLANALLILQPGNYVTFSDAEGGYYLGSLKAGKYFITCSAEGYRTIAESLYVSQSLHHNIMLNGMPYFKTLSLKTHHLSRWFPIDDVYYLEMLADVGDMDGLGDVATVVFEIPNYSFTDTLAPEIEAGLFKKISYSSNLPVSQIHELTGKPFVFIVRDDLGAQTAAPPQYLTRIIAETPTLLAPVEFQIISDQSITFQWQKMRLPFPISFKIEIYRINMGLDTKVDEINNIPGSVAFYNYSSLLLSGEYFWTLYIIDEYGNSSRSKEGAFRIP